MRHFTEGQNEETVGSRRALGGQSIGPHHGAVPRTKSYTASPPGAEGSSQPRCISTNTLMAERSHRFAGNQGPHDRHAVQPKSALGCKTHFPVTFRSMCGVCFLYTSSHFFVFFHVKGEPSGA